MQPTTITIPSQPGAVLVVDTQNRTTLLVNLDAANTIYLGNDSSVDTTDPANNVPLPPGATVVMDNTLPWYAATQTGQSATIAVIPGGINFFQLLSFIVRSISISGAHGGLFVYNPALGANNLTESIAAQNGVDLFGNQILSGITAYSLGFGIYFACQLFGDGLHFYVGGPTEATPYGFIGQVGAGVLDSGTATGLYIKIGPNFALQDPGLSGTKHEVWVGPSNDTTGTTDYHNMNFAMSTFRVVHPMPGDFYFNNTPEIPINFGTLRGAGSQDNSPSTQKTTFHMAGGGGVPAANLNAIIATAGWLEGTNTTTKQPCIIEDIFFDGNASNQTPGTGQQNGVVLQTFASAVRRCNFQNFNGDGLKFDYFDVTGTVAVTSSGQENRVEDCVFRAIAGIPIHTTDPLSAGIYTDGFIEKCTIAPNRNLASQVSKNDAILIGQSAGWLIRGCHLYGMNANGIHCIRPAATRIIGNDIDWALDSFGSLAVAGTYYGIIAEQGNGGALPVIIVANNVSYRKIAPVGSSVNGMHISSNTGATLVNALVKANSVLASVGLATAGIVYENVGGGTINALSDNQVNGWTAAVTQIPNTGVINYTNTGV